MSKFNVNMIDYINCMYLQRDSLPQARAPTHRHTHTHTRTNACTHAHMHTYTYIYIKTNRSLPHICTCTHAHMCTCAHAHTRTYAHMHLHEHIYIPTDCCLKLERPHTKVSLRPRCLRIDSLQQVSQVLCARIRKRD